MNTTGGPAYPTSNYGAIVPISTGYSEGMTLRDYFAGQALASVNLGIGVSDEYYRKTANHCYAMADAMLKAREA
jgi:hypothetical protein